MRKIKVIKSGIKNIFMSMFAMVFFAVQVHAKQVLTMLNGEEIEVEIVTLGSSEISYKKASNPDGPIYSVGRDKVFFILYEDGTKEIITSLEQPISAVNADAGTAKASGGSLAEVAMVLASDGDKESPKKVYFDHIAIYPRVSIGYQATTSGYKDSYDLDWGGLAWSCDLNFLFPSGANDAWSIGFGAYVIGGTMNMLYTQSGKNHKEKMGDFTAKYLTVPFEWWWRLSDSFMLGCGTRLEFLVTQTADGKSVKDAFRGFRNSILLDGIYTLGNFDLGLQMVMNLTNALKGEDLDWSPTIGIGVTLGYRF